jgi:predicted amidohydrolase
MIMVVIIVLCQTWYFRWAKWDRIFPPDQLLTEPIAVFDEIGQNNEKGNLLGLQPWVTPTDYAWNFHLRQKLSDYLKEAQEKHWLVPQKTILVLPEYFGTWLVVEKQRHEIYKVNSIQDAMTTIVLSNPSILTSSYWKAPEGTKDKLRYAVFANTGEQMARSYTEIFSDLAQLYQITIVAGSILLPNPRVENGQVVAGEGPLYNVTAVFRPDGMADPQLVRKLYPINDELPFVCPSNPDSLPVFDTPAGKLGVLVCADSWNSPAYAALRKKGATLLAVPSYSAGDGCWAKPWGGYSGTPTPVAAKADVGKLTEEQAWLKYAMGGRAKAEAGITKGMNVFLRGNLWDLGSDGTTVVLNDSLHVTKSVKGASLTCLWL